MTTRRPTTRCASPMASCARRRSSTCKSGAAAAAVAEAEAEAASAATAAAAVEEAEAEAEAAAAEAMVALPPPPPPPPLPPVDGRRRRRRCRLLACAAVRRRTGGCARQRSISMIRPAARHASAAGLQQRRLPRRVLRRRACRVVAVDGDRLRQRRRWRVSAGRVVTKVVMYIAP